MGFCLIKQLINLRVGITGIVPVALGVVEWGQTFINGWPTKPVVVRRCHCLWFRNDILVKTRYLDAFNFNSETRFC